MPIFEYTCESCGTRFEKLIRRESEITELQCPACGAQRLEKQLSTFAAHSGRAADSALPMCPSGGVCPTPGKCGMPN